MTGLDKAIRVAGGKSRLAQSLGIKPSSLSRWIGRYQGRPPAERVQQIYKITGVTPNELRPDLYPAPSELNNQARLGELVGVSVRESAELHCAVIANAPPATLEREALEAIAALTPFAPGHRVLIIPKSQ
ncbi:helix-turn-helix domain-containing protein [Salmonella enterica]|nr:helix-turn-helix domain-containing protein [Salmonella enterica]